MASDSGDPRQVPAPTNPAKPLTDTPVKKKSGSKHAANVAHHREKDETNQKLWMDEMKGKINVFDGSVEEFLNKFLPCATPFSGNVRRDVFQSVPRYDAPVRKSMPRTKPPKPRPRPNKSGSRRSRKPLELPELDEEIAQAAALASAANSDLYPLPESQFEDVFTGTRGRGLGDAYNQEGGLFASPFASSSSGNLASGYESSASAPPTGPTSDADDTDAGKGNDTTEEPQVKPVLERDMYQALVMALNEISSSFAPAPVIQFRKFGDSGRYFDRIYDSTSLHLTRPDIGGGHPGFLWSKNKEEFDRQLSWNNIAVTIEAKRANEDPIRGTAGAKDGAGAVLLRQICKNARNQMAANGSCAVFVLACFREQFRFFMVDRAGAVASKAFFFKSQPELIADFLWRFVHPPGGVPIHGADSTIRAADSAEKERLCSALIDLGRAPDLAKTLAATSRRMTIPLQRAFTSPPPHSDQSAGDTPGAVHEGSKASADDVDAAPGTSTVPTERTFYTFGGPRDWSTSLFSRGTFVWNAIDLDDASTICVLKDSWRQEGRQAECEFYELLESPLTEKPGVEPGSRPEVNIGLPEYGCGADLHKAKVEWQRTASASINSAKEMERVHMRTTMKTVGIPLEKFSSTKQLVGAVRDAIMGHWNAVEKDVLHRDVSIGNVMITAEGSKSRGFLHDFDYSVQISLRASDSNSDNKERTGTVCFMAHQILREPPPLHEECHDLESFYWLLVYVVFFYVRHDHQDEEAGSDLFDNWRFARAAGMKLAWLVAPQGALPVRYNEPLETLLEDFRTLCANYANVRNVAPQPFYHKDVVAIFDNALSKEWPTADAALPHKSKRPKKPETPERAIASEEGSLMSGVGSGVGSKRRSIGSELGDDERRSRSKRSKSTAE